MNYHNINHDDQNNGDGLRVVLWLSGCSHHCNKCQNPQTWNSDSGIPFDNEAKQELFTELSKDYISGITLSGGDPLYKKILMTFYHFWKKSKKNSQQKQYGYIRDSHLITSLIVSDMTNKEHFSLQKTMQKCGELFHCATF